MNRHEDLVDQDNGATIRELHAEVVESLDQLRAAAGFVLDLLDSRQRGLGFLTPEGRRILDAQLQADRRQRRTQPERLADDGSLVLGLDWLNRDTHVAGTGHIPAPAAVSATAVDAEILFTLHHLIRRVTARLERAGLCTLHRLPAEPTYGQLFDHLANLVKSAPSPTLLTEVQRELDHLLESTSLVVDGNDRTHLGDCPHCGRSTLVVYFRDEIVRCDRDPHTGTYAPCRCEDRYCDCKRSPVSFRHTWYRSVRNSPKPRTAHDWHDLASRLNIQRASKETCP